MTYLQPLLVDKFNSNYYTYLINKPFMHAAIIHTPITIKLSNTKYIFILLKLNNDNSIVVINNINNIIFIAYISVLFAEIVINYKFIY